MKIHSKIVIDIASGRVLKRQSFDYFGPVAKLKGGTQSSSTTNTSLPAWLQPYAEKFIQSYASQAFDVGPNGEYTPKQAGQLQQQLAGFNPDQLNAMAQVRSMNAPSNQLAMTNANEANRTISGQYLDPNANPYLNATYNQAARATTANFQNAVMPGLTAAAQRAGQFGSSAMNESIGQAANSFQTGLNDLATQIYGGNYQAERGRMQQEQQLLPSTMSSMYAPAYQLSGIGAQQQSQAQAGMDTTYSNAVSQFELPFDILSGFGSALGQAGQGSGSSTTSGRGSSGGGFMGK